MKGPLVLAVALVALVLLALQLRSSPKPRPSGSPSASSSASDSTAPAGPLWPLAVGNRWTYRETSPDAPGERTVSVVVAAEERTGVRITEEREGKSAGSDTLEERGDGYYWFEHELAQNSARLIPSDLGKTRDWNPGEKRRANVVRETGVTVGERAVPAFEIRFEKQGGADAQEWREEFTLTFAPGIGIVGKDTTRSPGPEKPVPGKSHRQRWEFVSFAPAKP